MEVTEIGDRLQGNLTTIKFEHPISVLPDEQLVITVIDETSCRVTIVNPNFGISLSTIVAYTGEFSAGQP